MNRASTDGMPMAGTATSIPVSGAHSESTFRLDLHMILSCYIIIIHISDDGSSHHHGFVAKVAASSQTDGIM